MVREGTRSTTGNAKPRVFTNPETGPTFTRPRSKPTAAKPVAGSGVLTKKAPAKKRGPVAKASAAVKKVEKGAAGAVRTATKEAKKPKTAAKVKAAGK